MLQISAEARGALETYARPLFAKRLAGQLSDEYLHFLPRFAEPVRLKIVANMLSRASVWGLSRQNSLTAWCHLMIVVAPNFDDESEIHDALSRLDSPRDRGVLSINKAVSAQAWDRAVRRHSNLPFFVPPQLARASIAEQVTAAIPVALYDRPEVSNAANETQKALALSAQLGLTEIPDSALVLCACRSFWGEGFTQQSWFVDMLRERWAPATIVEAIRFRLALEFGRYI